MPTCTAFSVAAAKQALLGTPDGYTDWELVPVSDVVIPDNALLSSLAPAFPAISAMIWDVREYVAADPEAIPPVEEVLPLAFLTNAPFVWTNNRETAITVRNVVVTAMIGGERRVLFWSEVDPVAIIEPSDDFKLTEFTFRLAELADM